MKIKIYILLLVPLGTSCNDFLEEDSRSLVSTDVFYTNLNEATNALYGVYNNLQPLYDGLGIAAVSDLAADILDPGAGAGGSQALVFDDFSFDASIGILESYYQGSYGLINDANTLIYKMGENQYSDPDLANVIIGEAKFLRGLAYFNLVQLFSDVPLRTEPSLSTAGLDLARTSAPEIYEVIISDLEDAVELLNETSIVPGRANKIAAHTLLGKVYLTLDSYSNAITQFEEVIGKRSLYEDFGDNFKIANENNLIESIFEVQYGFRPENSNILQYINSDRLTSHGFIFGVYSVNMDLVNSFDPADERFAVSLWDNRNDVAFGAWFVNKYNDGLQIGVQASDAGRINFPLLRYADVLLMYAEALNAENNGPNQAAYDAVNEVRNRAELVDLPLGLTESEFLDAVLEERKKEFIVEGHRWFDLKRNNKLAEVLSSKGFVQGTNEIWPIPQAARDANQNLTQNPNY